MKLNIVFFAFQVISIVACQQNNFLHVWERGGSTEGSCGTVETPCKHLEHAVEKCSEGGVIVVQGHQTIRNTINVLTDLNVIGRKGATFAGNMTDETVFRVLGPVHFTLQNLNFNNVGMITLFSRSVVSVKNCIVRYVSKQLRKLTERHGVIMAPIYIGDSIIRFQSKASRISLNVTNCTFTGWKHGYLLRMNTCSKDSIIFDNCTFTDNLGMHLFSIDEVSLTVKNCTFQNIWCTAIHMENYLHTPFMRLNFVIMKSLFIDNKGCDVNQFYAANGGAVRLIGDMFSLEILESKFVNCSTSCHSQKPMDSGSGGAVYINGKGLATIFRSSFDSNSACMDGGDLFMGKTNVNLTECVFSNSLTNHGRGGSTTIEYFITAELFGCLFANNTAKKNGGALALNWVKRATLSKCSFERNKATEEGGAIWVNRRNVIIKLCNFYGNIGDLGGGIMIKGSLMEENKQLIVVRSLLQGNQATVGGGIYIGKSKVFCRVAIKTCTFSNNSASSYGQSIYNNDDISMENTLIVAYEKYASPHLRFDDGEIHISNMTVQLYRDSGYKLSSKSIGFTFSSTKRINLLHGLTFICPMNFNVGEMKNATELVEKMKPASSPIMKPVKPVKLVRYRNPRKKPKKKPKKKRNRQGRSVIMRWRITKYTYFGVNCIPCSSSSYSLHSGRMYVPELSTKDPPENNVTLKNGKCEECPTGAFCDIVVKAVDNFWGYTDVSKLSMKVCPRGFCCGDETVPCISFNTCAIGRKGTLCGTCDEGYKQNFLGSDCIPQGETCDTKAFVVYVFCYTFSYAIMIIVITNAKDIVMILKRRLFKKESPEPEEITSESNISIAGFVQIIILFFQVASLLQVKFQNGKQDKENSLANQIRDDISEMFNFRFVIYHQLCPSDDLDLPQKEMILVGMRMATFFHLLLFVFIYKAITVVACWTSQNCLSTSPSVEEQPTIELMVDDSTEERSIEIPAHPEDRPATLSFMSMLKCTVVKLLKLYYTPIMVSAFKLVHCVNIKDESRLYVFGDHVCYSVWQLGIVFVLLPCLLMFPICFELALRMLKAKQISSWQFVLVTSCPCYALTVYAWKKHRTRHNKEETSALRTSCDEEESFRLTILEGEEMLFEEVGKYSLGWQIIQFYRTFAITLLSVFIINPIYRHLAYNGLILVFAVHDIYRKPYKHRFLNHLQFLTSVCLIIVLLCNAIPATSYLVNIRNVPSIKGVMKMLDAVELMVYAVVPLSLPLWKLKEFIEQKRRSSDEEHRSKYL